VFVLRSDIIPVETRLALLIAAGAVLLSRHGSLAEQLDRLEQTPPSAPRLQWPRDRAVMRPQCRCRHSSSSTASVDLRPTARST